MPENLFRRARRLLDQKDSGARLTEEEYQLRLRILELASILEGHLKFLEWQNREGGVL
ncbi:hypothetical protein ES703_99928 [subsurface metagenome]